MELPAKKDWNHNLRDQGCLYPLFDALSENADGLPPLFVPPYHLCRLHRWHVAEAQASRQVRRWWSANHHQGPTNGKAGKRRLCAPMVSKRYFNVFFFFGSLFWFGWHDQRGFGVCHPLLCFLLKADPSVSLVCVGWTSSSVSVIRIRVSCLHIGLVSWLCSRGFETRPRFPHLASVVYLTMVYQLELGHTFQSYAKSQRSTLLSAGPQRHDYNCWGTDKEDVADCVLVRHAGYTITVSFYICLIVTLLKSCARPWVCFPDVFCLEGIYH